VIEKAKINNEARSTDSRDGHRANLYRLLADCYRYPVAELADELALLQQEASALANNLGASAKALRGNFQQPGGLNQLGIAYSKLFIGPRELLAPPYGSVYMEANRQVMGNSTLGVMARYVEAGLNPSQDNKEPPDHISTEMEFMYYLVFEHLRCREERFADKQREFFLACVYPWVPRFATAISRSRTHPFYSSLATVTTDFIVSEAKLFNKTEGG